MERCAARLQPSAVQCELSAEQKLVTIVIFVLTLVILAVMMKKREQEQKKAFEIEASKVALEEWKDSIGEDEKKEILKKKQRFETENTFLKVFFHENIWPDKKKEILGLE